MTSNDAPYFSYCEAACDGIEKSLIALADRFRPISLKYTAYSYFIDNFQNAVTEVFRAEIDLIRSIQLIAANHRSDESLISQCGKILDADYDAFSYVKSFLSSNIFPNGVVSKLVVHATMRELVVCHRPVLETIKSSADIIVKELQPAIDRIERSRSLLQWLFRIFAIYPSKQSTQLQELLDAGGERFTQEGLDIFYDKLLSGGTFYDPALKDILEKSDVVIAVLSKEFFGSDYIVNTELKIVEEKLNNLACILLPVIFSDCDCDWKKHPWISRIQCTPHGCSILSLHSESKGREEYLKKEITEELILSTVRKLSGRGSAIKFVEDLRMLAEKLKNRESGATKNDHICPAPG